MNTKQEEEPIDCKIITINIANQYLDAIQSFIDKGLYSSRSEFVREALRHFLISEPIINKELTKDFLETELKKVRRKDLIKEVSESFYPKEGE